MGLRHHLRIEIAALLLLFAPALACGASLSLQNVESTCDATGIQVEVYLEPASEVLTLLSFDLSWDPGNFPFTPQCPPELSDRVPSSASCNCDIHLEGGGMSVELFDLSGNPVVESGTETRIMTITFTPSEQCTGCGVFPILIASTEGRRGPIPVSLDCPQGEECDGSITIPCTPPTISSVDPSSGPVTGDTSVTITGSGYTTSEDTQVTLGELELQDLIVADSQTITGVTPSADSPGAVDVTVTNSNGSDSLPGGFTYEAVSCTLTTSVEPTGAGTVTLQPEGPYECGDVVELCAQANQGWKFSHWSEGGSDIANSGCIEITVDREREITLHFVSWPWFRRGDCSNDGTLDLADAIRIADLLFVPGTTVPDCLLACEVHGDGQIDIADAVYLLDYLFRSGPPPASPFPECGPKPEDSAYPCESFANCP